MYTIPVQVEKNIPPPPTDAGSSMLGALRTMEIGESFAVPAKHTNSLRAATSAIGRAHSRKFTTSVDRAAGVVRVWRLA